MINIDQDNQEREHLPEWWGSWADSFGYRNIPDSQASQEGRNGSDSNRVIRYFSMFTGVGGFELGLEKAGRCGQEEILFERGSGGIGIQSDKRQHPFNRIGFSEIDRYANQVLKYRFPDVRNYGDCTKIDPETLPDFDLLCGGFPCQTFSIAGKRLGFEDTRGTLFFDIARIAKSKRPRIIFLENVKGLLSHDSGRTFAVILSTLDELGYDVEWEVLNSKNFGVPQNRERVFIVGHIREGSWRKIFPLGETNEQTIGTSGESTTIIQSGVRSKGKPRFYDNITPTIGQDAGTGGGNVPMVAERQPLRYLDRNQRNIEGDYMFAIDGSQTSGLKVGSKIRRLTPIECERLQGFPDNWTQFGINEKGQKVQMSDTQRYKMMGNAVTVNVIQAIAESFSD